MSQRSWSINIDSVIVLRISDQWQYLQHCFVVTDPGPRESKFKFSDWLSVNHWTKGVSLLAFRSRKSYHSMKLFLIALKILNWVTVSGKGCMVLLYWFILISQISRLLNRAVSARLNCSEATQRSTVRSLSTRCQPHVRPCSLPNVRLARGRE